VLFQLPRAPQTRVDGLEHDREICRLYLELAFDCFNKAGEAELNAAETLRQMGLRYLTEAAALDPSLRRSLAKAPDTAPSKKQKAPNSRLQV
jgi:hypothetical protein